MEGPVEVVSGIFLPSGHRPPTQLTTSAPGVVGGRRVEDVEVLARLEVVGGTEFTFCDNRWQGSVH